MRGLERLPFVHVDPVKLAQGRHIFSIESSMTIYTGTGERTRTTMTRPKIIHLWIDERALRKSYPMKKWTVREY